MRFIATIVVAFVWSISPLSVQASTDNPQALFSRLKKSVGSVESAKLVVADQLPQDSIFFSTDEGGGTVYLHTDLVKALNTDQLVVVIAHELSHIALGHHARLRAAPESELAHLQWTFEYDADASGVKAARMPGVDAKSAFAQLMRTFKEASSAHPSGMQRLKAVKGGDREFPISIEVANSAAP